MNHFGVGLRFGTMQIVVAPERWLADTYVDNCATAFLAAAERDVAGLTFNIVDPDRAREARAWNFSGAIEGRAALRLPCPYQAMLWIAHAMTALNGIVPRPYRQRLPGAFNPREVEARFKPVEICSVAARETLGWVPHVSRVAALRRCSRRS